MTNSQNPMPKPWEMASVYAATFGLFAPGALMAARLQTLAKRAPALVETSSEAR